MRDDCLNPMINKRAKHFARKRRVAEAFHNEGYYQMAQHLSDCQEVTRQCICTDCLHVFYIQDRCRQRVCPLCSYTASRERGDWIERMCHHMKFPKMLTLTMPRWTAVPGDGIDYIRACWNQLRASKVFDKVRGGVYQIELKPKENGWHIHIHAILDCPFLPYQHIFNAWRRILGLPSVSIDIRAATTPAEQHYVAKYAAKSADYEGDIPQVVAWWLATKGKRLFGTFGEWYNQQPPDDPENPQPIAQDFCCPHCGKKGVCCSRDNLPFFVDRDMRRHYENAMAEHGPPTVPIW